MPSPASNSGRARLAAPTNSVALLLPGLEDGLEELQGDAEREVALELVPCRTKSHHPARARELRRGLEERGLALALLALEQQQRSRSFAGPPEGILDDQYLSIAFQQHPCHLTDLS